MIRWNAEFAGVHLEDIKISHAFVMFVNLALDLALSSVASWTAIALMPNPDGKNGYGAKNCTFTHCLFPLK